MFRILLVRALRMHNSVAFYELNDFTRDMKERMGEKEKEKERCLHTDDIYTFGLDQCTVHMDKCHLANNKQWHFYRRQVNIIGRCWKHFNNFYTKNRKSWICDVHFRKYEHDE